MKTKKKKAKKKQTVGLPPKLLKAIEKIAGMTQAEVLRRWR